MRQATVYLNDYVTGRRLGITFSARDYDIVDEKWDQEDQRLISYQGIESFRGRTRYCDLTTQHLRIMIQQVLLSHTSLTDAERGDGHHPVVALLNQLALYLVRCIENTVDCSVDVLTINRISERNVAFAFSANMSMDFSKPQPKEPKEPAPEPSPFTVINLDDK